MNKPPPYYCRSTNGSVFIVVLVVSLGLVSLAVYFGNSMMMAYRGSDNDLAGRQADQAIEGAARYAEYLMGQVSSPGTLPDPTSYQSEAVSIGDATFWFIGEPTPSDPVDQPVFGLVDEASKLNLNTASQAMIQGLPGMTAELAAAIVAWRKPSSDTTAASSGFSFANVPAKNAPFESVGELALLTGTDQSLLYGEDANLNHALETDETDAATTFSATSLNGTHGLLDYFTVFSREINKRADGSARVDVTKRLPDLRILLSNALDETRADAILQKIWAPGQSPITNVLQFYIRSGMTEEEFDKVSNDLTAKSGDFLTGLVNVNTANEAVLTCIPGILDKAAQLIAARQNRATPSTNLAWVVPVLGEQGAVEAGPFLTTRSFQISADIAAVGHNGRGYRRTQFIIDSSTGTPRIVYRRNLAALGWALGSNARETLAASKEVQ